MATLVAHTQLLGSTEEGLDDIELDVAANGTVHARAFYTARKRKWKLKHLLTATELNALLTFYDSYRTTLNTFTWQRDSTAYSVFFVGPPQYTTVKPGATTVGLFDVTVELRQQ